MSDEPGRDGDPGYVSADGLGLASRHRTVFADVGFAFPRGGLGVVQGPAGSGRSSLLLAVGGRMRGLTGALSVAGFDGVRQTRQIRRLASVARISRLVDLEGQLTVGESVTERALIDAVPSTRAPEVLTRAETVLGRTFDPSLLVDDLPALDRTLLAVALACLRPAPLLLLDDANTSLDLADQRLLMAALLRLTATGVTVVASTLEGEAVPPTATLCSLPPSC